MEYASNGKGNAALTTGIIGTALAGLTAMGGLSGLFGTRTTQSDGDRPVTRYEMELIQAGNAKDTEIASLKSQLMMNQAMAGVQAQFSQQNAWNMAESMNMQTIRSQLSGITRTVIPNSSIVPGWGTVETVAANAASATSTTGSGN